MEKLGLIIQDLQLVFQMMALLLPLGLGEMKELMDQGIEDMSGFISTAEGVGVS